MQLTNSDKKITVFINRIKWNWQIIFTAGVILYGLSLLHFFNLHPTMRNSVLPYFSTIDIFSFMVAIALAFYIFALKRRYFSRKFSRNIIKQILKEIPDESVDNLLDIILEQLRGKFQFIWLLGFLLILDGILFYWITYSSRNMHMYAIVGAYSLLMNYPRKDFFINLPWDVREIKKELSGQDEKLLDI